LSTIVADVTYLLECAFLTDNISCANWCLAELQGNIDATLQTLWRVSVFTFTFSYSYDVKHS